MQRHLCKSMTLCSLLGLLVICGCIRNKTPASQVREFSSTNLAGKVVDVTFPVSQFSGTNYRIERIEASAQQKQDPDLHRSAISQLFHHDVTFEPLSEENFAKLKDFWWAENPLTYEARRFHLYEFLPPAMQATMNADFRDQDGFIKYNGILTIPDADTRDTKLSRIAGSYFIRPNFSVRSNCWTTAYEILRQRHDTFLHFFASDTAMWKYLASEKGIKDESPYSVFVKSLTWEESCLDGTQDGVRSCPPSARDTRNRNLKAGDLLLIVTDDERIVHAAIYLADDLFFERAGVRSGHLYRINTWAEIAKIYSLGKQHTAVFRRFQEAGLKSLPDPRDVFGTNTREEREIDASIREDLRKQLKAIHQPGVGDKRDVAIYPYSDIPIVTSSESGTPRYTLAPESREKSYFTRLFD